MNDPKPISLQQTPNINYTTNDPQPYMVVGDIPGLPAGGVAGQHLSRASNAPNDNEWVSPPGTPLVYGSFYDTITQPLTPINTVIPVKIRLTHTDVGVVKSGDSGIKALQTGVYNFQFSLQVTSTTNQTRNLHIWGRLNGANLAHSAGRISITEQNSVIVPAWNYILPMNANDVFDLCAAVDGTGVSLAAEPASAVYPEAASAIITVHQLGQ